MPNNAEAMREALLNPLATTDPELVSYLGDFAFDEVWGREEIDERTHLLVVLTALIACQSNDEYRLALDVALDAGITPVEAREVVYQTVPYLGMAKALDFVAITNQVLEEHGLGQANAPQSTTTKDDRFEKGLAVQREIFGAEHIDPMRDQAPAATKHIQDYLSANCFGDNYTRGGLELKLRELLTFVILVSHGGCDPQAQGHAAGNIRYGNSREYLIQVVTQLVPWIGYPRSLNAFAAIEKAAQSQ